MSSVEELLRAVVVSGITAHPRSLQKRIGPSEIGKPCDRWILRKLNGDEEPERGIPWKPAIGTAMHAQFEEWFNAANFGGGEISSTEWITEWGVTVGRIGGQDITGHADLFHVPTGTVVDFKFVGAKQLAKYRLHGPSEQYRTQAHLYAKGFTDDNGWGPAKTVAIWFLPREGEFDSHYYWSEPYDPHRAFNAMTRANRLYTMLQVVGIDAALAASPLCDDQWCTWCKTEKRAQQRAAGGSLFGDFFAPDPTAPIPAAPHLPIPPAPAIAQIAPRCTVCHQPMSPMVTLGGFTTHPTCDVDVAPETPAAPTRPVHATPAPAGVAPVINLFNR